MMESIVLYMPFKISLQMKEMIMEEIQSGPQRKTNSILYGQNMQLDTFTKLEVGCNLLKEKWLLQALGYSSKDTRI